MIIEVPIYDHHTKSEMHYFKITLPMYFKIVLMYIRHDIRNVRVAAIFRDIRGAGGTMMPFTAKTNISLRLLLPFVKFLACTSEWNAVAIQRSRVLNESDKTKRGGKPTHTTNLTDDKRQIFSGER
jgi:hypothetical protein